MSLIQVITMPIQPSFDLESMDLLIDAVADSGYGVFADLLSDDIQQDLIQLLEAKELKDKFVRAGVGSGQEVQVRSEIRSDSIMWLEPESADPSSEAWIKGMNTLCERFRSQLYLSVCSYEGHLVRYPAAGFYKAHLDRHAKTLAREISIIVYLNKDWGQDDGGQLRLYTDSEKGVTGPYIDVLPEAGTVVIFRSAIFWHEVLPSKRPRLSLTGWLRGPEDVL